ncbi:MAG: anhydro-N-acetylmuramic acid kinase [Rhodobacteraceae bacterium]|nr:anhydro-N-acetylmuramic acid kinase [Paracoccaceae bacterium]
MRPVRRVLGMMSGTSLDGVDAALLETDGAAVLRAGESAYRPYSEAERAVLAAALGHWPGTPEAEAAARVVEAAHVDVARGFERVELVGFHGQTLAHDPGRGRTHQAGCGARVAEALGCAVVWDFRSSDMALGGQGAPLAPFYHFALARAAGEAPLAFLNLGGVANLTLARPALLLPEAEGALLAFDCGPANAPMDDLARARGLGGRDDDGRLALSGAADSDIVAAFLGSPYLTRMPPKSLDRNEFHWLLEAVAELSDNDALATLAACAVAGVLRGMAEWGRDAATLLACGGGRHNGALMAGLRAGLAQRVLTAEEAGLEGDMIEAQAFAYLAARVAAGLPTSCPGTTGVAAAVGGGQISRP